MSDDSARPSGSRVLISANPKAGAICSRPLVQRYAELIAEQGLEVELIEDLNVLGERANRLFEQGVLRVVVAAGGDGTAAELVNRCEPGVPITVLPLGTENLLAKYVGFSADPQTACRTVALGRTIRLDTGKANGRLFVLVASCGFDADVVRRLHSFRRGNIRHRDYVRPILQSIRSYEYPAMRVYCDGARQPQGDRFEQPLAAHWLFVLNLPCYAGGLPLAPGAHGSDGLLDLCALRGGSLWRGLWYLAHLVCGQHTKLRQCYSGRLRRLRVESDRPVPYQLDGDPGGWLPLEIEIVPERLTLLVPPDDKDWKRAGKPSDHWTLSLRKG